MKVKVCGISTIIILPIRSHIRDEVISRIPNYIGVIRVVIVV